KVYTVLRSNPKGEEIFSEYNKTKTMSDATRQQMISILCPSAFIRNYLRSISEWPSPFPIPVSSYDVEQKLCKGNKAYERTKNDVSITRDMKMNILDQIVLAVFEVKAHPDQDQIE
ncbi:hypothetical protein ATANTOWER_031016, partial [Ataeniobius toweri]|nr:hypothetical protein [Ataeniobius toweri]